MHAVEAQLELLLNGARHEDIIQAEEALRQSEAKLKLTQDDFRRTQELFRGGTTTEKQMDDAGGRLTIAQAQRNSAEQALNKLRQLARSEEIRAARAKLEQAKSSRDLLKKTIADCHITAPLNGIITEKPVELKTRFIPYPMLEIECERTIDALELLQKQDWVKEISVFGTYLHLSVEQEEVSDKLPRLLGEANIALKRLERIMPSLEDVFIHLVEE